MKPQNLAPVNRETEVSTAVATVQPRAIVATPVAMSGSSAELSVLANPYAGISQQRVSEEAAATLMGHIDPDDVEIRPDGIIYLPEIKYRRILNQAFGPAGWALMPRSEISMHDSVMSREYALYAGGRFVSIARGEQEYFERNGNMSYATAAEAAKSNAMMRCCKDLGIASELWDPRFIREWTAANAVQVWRKSTTKPAWRRKDAPPFYDEAGAQPVPGGARKPSVPFAPSAPQQETKVAHAPPKSKPKPTAQEPEPAPPETETTEEDWLEVSVLDIREKHGTKTNGQEWTLYGVQMYDEIAQSTLWANTFSATDADVARSVLGTKNKIRVQLAVSSPNGKPRTDLVKAEPMDNTLGDNLV